jgi:hypothetical protein
LRNFGITKPKDFFLNLVLVEIYIKNNSGDSLVRQIEKCNSS